MKKFTIAEKGNGELAVRDMSAKAQSAYNGTDLLSVYKYIDYDATAKAEEEAFNNDIDFFPGEFDVVRYAINYSGCLTLDLSFEQVEKYLEEYAEALEECEVSLDGKLAEATERSAETGKGEISKEELFDYVKG